METINLHQFLEQTGLEATAENLREDFPISGVSTDSRTLQPGDLFIAIRGENYDGHDYTAEVIRKGAAAVTVSEKKLKTTIPPEIGKVIVPDTVSFLMMLAGWYRKRFTTPLVAITGSTGKTTTKEMLSAVLGTCFRIQKTRGNQNNFIGVSLTLLEMNRSAEIAVVELGTNHPGEIEALTEITRPTHAAITNIGKGHIGFFGSREAIFKEKKSLFDGLQADSVIFVNADDPYLRRYHHTGRIRKSFGLEDGCDYQGTLLGIDPDGCVEFAINGGPKIQLRVPGRHQLSNALLAGSVGLEMGVSAELVKEGLQSVTAYDKRMQIIRRNGILLINDAYNSNPESLRAAIDYLCDLPATPTSRKFLVLGDMLELGEHSEIEHRQIGQYLVNKPIQFIFVIGEYSHFIREEIEQSQPGSAEIAHFRSHQQLGRSLKERIRPGDILLLKGSRGMAVEKVLDYLAMGK